MMGGVDDESGLELCLLDLLQLQLWDTAGQERFRKSMVQHYYRNSISSWMQEVESHGLARAPRVLVGN
ncbi:Ras-related protein Rab-33B, partial [Operophtera brumata]